jgi:hypothetical protein
MNGHGLHHTKSERDSLEDLGVYGMMMTTMMFFNSMALSPQANYTD